MVAIFQTKFSNAFHSIAMYEFRWKFYWCFFLIGTINSIPALAQIMASVPLLGDRLMLCCWMLCVGNCGTYRYRLGNIWHAIIIFQFAERANQAKITDTECSSALDAEFKTMLITILGHDIYSSFTFTIWFSLYTWFSSIHAISVCAYVVNTRVYT